MAALLLKERERWSREAAALETRSLAAEKLAADRLPALQQAAHLQASLHAAHTAKAEALDVRCPLSEHALVTHSRHVLTISCWCELRVA